YELVAAVRRVAPAAARDPALAEGPRPNGAPSDPVRPDEKADPHALIKQGREMLNAGLLDEAEKMVVRADAVPTRWGLFEDSPDKLRRDIQKGRAQHNQEESGRVLAGARQLVAAGNLRAARTKAFQAEQLHGPYSVWEMGDRPARLIAEIEKAEAANKNKTPTPPPAPPAQFAKNQEPGVRSQPS